MSKHPRPRILKVCRYYKHTGPGDQTAYLVEFYNHLPRLVFRYKRIHYRKRVSCGDDKWYYPAPTNEDGSAKGWIVLKELKRHE